MHCPRGVKEHRCHAHRFQQQALPDAPAVQKAADDGGEPTPAEVGGDTQQRHGVRAHGQQLNDDPRSEHRPHPLLEAVYRCDEVIGHVAPFYRQATAARLPLADVQRGHGGSQAAQTDDGCRQNHHSKAERGHNAVRAEIEKARPEAHKHQRRGRHGGHGHHTAVRAEECAGFALLG